jgi:ADP-heptose:LPS heptosyltransferase/glycosyltransferase involved in cell wall biosynthesis
MNKTTVLLKGPLLVQCGYGNHTKQILKALLKDSSFEIFCENIRWGHCSFLTEDSEEKKIINGLIHKREMAKQQGFDKFDIFIHVTIPQEFEKLGKFNVGVTAAVETDRVSHQWIQKCNEMDLIIVPSEHSKKVIEKTTIEWKNQKTGESGTFSLNKPIAVVHEGVDTSIFKPLEWSKSILDIDFKTDFNFFHVGQWSKGGFGEDRKNIANLVKYFIETFNGRKDVGLVLKINMARNSVADKEAVAARLKQIKANFKKEEVPPIYLVHGNLTQEELSNLYNHPKIKAFVSLTHGEGFGLPLLEAAACDLPVIATNWSGHLDFLLTGKFSAVEYELKEIPNCVIWEPVLIKDSRWAVADEENSKHRLKKMFTSYTKPKQWSKQLCEHVHKNFSLEKTGNDFVTTIKQHMMKTSMQQINPLEHLQSFVDTGDDFNILYTMPRSTGDVFISTAVIDGLMKEVPKNAKLYFATDPKYFDILEDNPHIHKLIPWNQTMITTELTEEVFDLVFTPDTATQYQFSNWVRRGQGRLLAEEFANHCHCELGEYSIKVDNSHEQFPNDYITFHPGSGKDEWEARNYVEWQEIINNLKDLYPSLTIVQVGSSNEPLYEGAEDWRGKTTVHQLASLIKNSDLHLSIDTFTMHLAAAFNKPLVSLFGSSHAKSTGPWVKDKANSKFILMEAEKKMGCNKACYKHQCKVNKDLPCINEIDPAEVVEACSAMLDKKFEGKYEKRIGFKYQRLYKKISGYTTAYNAIKMKYPFEESIRSMLGFCDEVVVVDGESTDGTWEVLEKLQEEFPDKLQIYQNEWDLEEPGMDGMQKAFARALCEHEFLWQQDLDEVVHENDYEKIRMITKRFPTNVDILHLPVVELWGDENHVTGRRHAWKWRMSRNKPEITHGINASARLTDEETGKVYAKDGMSDGCEYINVMTNEMIPHAGFWNQNLEITRINMPEQYGLMMNQVFNQLPSIFHYSWCSLPLKIEQFKTNWDDQWNVLYQKTGNERFPSVDTKEQVEELVKELKEQGGESSDGIKYKFKLEKNNPVIMKFWIDGFVKDK